VIVACTCISRYRGVIFTEKPCFVSSFIDSITKPMFERFSGANALFRRCLCTNLGFISRGIFIDFSGIECISLGAISCDLTPRERIILASQQLGNLAEEIVSVSFMSDDNVIDSIPLEILTKVHKQTVRTLLSFKYRQIVHDIKVRDFRKCVVCLWIDFCSILVTHRSVHIIYVDKELFVCCRSL